MIALPAAAQTNTVEPQRLMITPTGPQPEDGHYAAGDEAQFWIDHQGGNVRLRFADSEEIFYLTVEPSTLGGRVLKYDTGDVALAVSGWGGVTLYTKRTPNGIPAERMGNAPNLEPRPVTARETQHFAATLSQNLETEERLNVGFAANWERISRGNRVRSLAIDAMRNASYALSELSENRDTKAAYADRIKVVRIVAAEAAAVEVENEVVTVSFDADGEASDRPSSRAIVDAIQRGPDANAAP
ncbi:MAG: hypothetical protein RJB62_1422 [Pseudomonadota bacterium]|jgi:hypothetical protein